MKINLSATPVEELWQDGLAVEVFSDEKPPRGLTGQVDWKLSGFISRSIEAGKITGSSGETVLLSPEGATLPPPKLLALGMGDRALLTPDRLTEAGATVITVLGALGCRSIAASIPGAGRCGYALRDLAEWFIRGMVTALHAGGGNAERWPSILIVETPDNLPEAEKGFQSLKARLEGDTRTMLEPEP